MRHIRDILDPERWLPAQREIARITGLSRVTVRRAASRPVRALQRICAVGLKRKEAGLLGLAPGAPGLRIERVSYLPGGRAVEFTRSLYRGEAYDFVAELRAAGEQGVGE